MVKRKHFRCYWMNDIIKGIRRQTLVWLVCPTPFRKRGIISQEKRTWTYVRWCALRGVSKSRLSVVTLDSATAMSCYKELGTLLSTRTPECYLTRKESTWTYLCMTVQLPVTDGHLGNSRPFSVFFFNKGSIRPPYRNIAKVSCEPRFTGNLGRRIQSDPKSAQSQIKI